MKRRRVLFVSHRFLPESVGGVEVYTFNALRSLMRDFEVSLLFTSTHPGKAHLSVERRLYRGIPCHVLINNYPFPPLCSSCRDRAMDRIFLGIIREVSPDIVHFQHLLFLSGGMIENALQRGIPAIFTLHDFHPLCPSLGKMLGPDLKICESIEPGRCHECYGTLRKGGGVLEEIALDLLSKWFPAPLAPYPYILFKGLPPFIKDILYSINSSPFLRNIRARFARGPSTEVKTEVITRRIACYKDLLDPLPVLISPSLFLRDFYLKNGFSHKDFRVIPHGIPLRDFSRTGKTRRRKTRRFLYLGNLTPEKGVHILIKAFSEPEPLPAELFIAGPGTINRSYFSDLKRCTRGNIRFLGPISREGVPGLLGSADALIFPSIWRENHPLTLLEARASGLPVIAFGIGGIPEVIQDGRDGILLPPGDGKALRRALEDCIATDILSALEKSVEPPPDITDNTKALKGIYYDLIEWRGGG